MEKKILNRLKYKIIAQNLEHIKLPNKKIPTNNNIEKLKLNKFI